MLPSKVSFVGVDTNTDLNELYEVQNLNRVNKFEEPWIEWGVLVSPSRMGKQKRYPSLQFAIDFAYSPNVYDRSIHLCGTAVDDYLFRPNSEIANFASTAVARIQLNFAINDYNLDELSEVLLDKILNKGDNLILQYNKSKKKFIDQLLPKLNGSKNLSILYDGSGGFGRVIEKFDPPFEDFYTGYAGGLKPENVEQIVRGISKVAGNTPYYIDMESGIRTEDYLDLEKCKSIMATLEKMRVEEVFE